MIIDQEAIYARTIGLLVSDRSLDLRYVFSTELAAYPPSMFTENGTMQIATEKASLKHTLGEEVSARAWDSPTVLIVDVSAILWTVDWPVKATVGAFVQIFKDWVSEYLSECSVVLAFDRYHEYSMNSSVRAQRADSHRLYKLDQATSLPTRDAVLECTFNKDQLNKLLLNHQ